MADDNPQTPAEVAPVAPLGTGLGADAGAIVAENEFDVALIDVNHIFLETFGVTITYYPHGGISRQVKAIVDYGQPQALGSMPQGLSPLTTICVANKATALSASDTGGILSSELDISLDKVELPIRLGRTAQQRRITGILSQDAAMLHLEVR